MYRLESLRQAWGEDQVFFYDEDGRLQRLPAGWTDAVEPDPFVATARGRAHFCVADLVRLVELVERLVEEQRCGR